MYSSVLAVKEDHIMQCHGNVVMATLQQWKRDINAVYRLCSAITATKNVIKYYSFYAFIL
jgi:hypothetical protein